MLAYKINNTIRQLYIINVLIKHAVNILGCRKNIFDTNKKYRYDIQRIFSLFRLPPMFLANIMVLWYAI